MQQLQSQSSSNAINTGMSNMPPAANQINQKNPNLTGSGAMMNQAAMQQNITPSGIAFNSGNMVSMMTNKMINPMNQQQQQINQTTPSQNQTQTNLKRQQQMNQIVRFN